MKRILLLILTAACLLVRGQAAPAADTTSEAATELKALVAKVQTKLRAGHKTAADLADELKEFDGLLAKHQGEKTDDVAQILFMKAMLYAQVFEDVPKSIQLMQQLKTDFPDTTPGKHADDVVTSLKKQEAAVQIQKSLVEGARFPDFDEKDLAGKPLSVANYKGKVVLVDFWATWCGPCVGELPNVIKAYEAHHPKGFEIIGISLDQDEQKLRSFLKERNVTWQQYFDGKGWDNKLSTKYGIQSIPATFLLDGEGKIIGKNLRGEALEQAVARALTKS